MKLGLEDPRIHSLILGYWHTIVTPPMVFAKNMVEVKNAMKAKGIEKPIVASLAGDIEVEEAADYLYQNGIVAYAYSTEIPVAVLGAKYKWARGAGLLYSASLRRILLCGANAPPARFAPRFAADAQPMAHVPMTIGYPDLRVRRLEDAIVRTSRSRLKTPADLYEIERRAQHAGGLACVFRSCSCRPTQQACGEHANTDVITTRVIFWPGEMRLLPSCDPDRKTCRSQARSAFYAVRPR